jgi:hypothetical protein
MNIFIEKTQFKMSPIHTIKMQKSYILNKHVNLLASNIIKTPINNINFMNIDINIIPLSILNQKKQKDYIITFNSFDYLNLLKINTNHPYTISKTKISDITYYLEKMNTDLLIINDVKCDNITKKSNYTAFNISIDELKKNNFYVDVKICKFFFDNSK